jgi:hypothetical protein
MEAGNRKSVSGRASKRHLIWQGYGMCAQLHPKEKEPMKKFKRALWRKKGKEKGMMCPVSLG